MGSIISTSQIGALENTTRTTYSEGPPVSDRRMSSDTTTQTPGSLAETLRGLRNDTTRRDQKIECGGLYIRSLGRSSTNSEMGKAVHKAWGEEQEEYITNSEWRHLLWDSYPCIRQQILSEKDRSVRVDEEAELTIKIRKWATELKEETKADNWEEVGAELKKSLEDRLEVLQNENWTLSARASRLNGIQWQVLVHDCTDFEACAAFAGRYGKISDRELTADSGDSSDE